jgi:hypothetical protein
MVNKQQSSQPVEDPEKPSEELPTGPKSLIAILRFFAPKNKVENLPAKQIASNRPSVWPGVPDLNSASARRSFSAL